jgi:hypothetical protein
VTYGSQIVNFTGLNLGNQSNQVGRIANISIVQNKFDAGFMTVFVDVVNPACV